MASQTGSTQTGHLLLEREGAWALHTHHGEGEAKYGAEIPGEGELRIVFP